MVYDKWNQELEQTNGALERKRTVRIWLVHILRPQFSVDECGEMILKYTETSNVLETIRRFQRQFPNRNVHYCRRSCSNLNHTGCTYCKWPLLFVCTVSCDSETCLWNLLIVSRTLPVSVYFKTINTRSSTEKCGLGCAPTIFVLFFCFLLHSSVSVLGFTYRKALEQLQNTWLRSICDHPFV